MMTVLFSPQTSFKTYYSNIIIVQIQG